MSEACRAVLYRAAQCRAVPLLCGFSAVWCRACTWSAISAMAENTEDGISVIGCGSASHSSVALGTMMELARRSSSTTVNSTGNVLVPSTRR